MKLFHIGDVLSITTGRLVSSKHIGGVYDILNYMTGDELYTHQLPRACDECLPAFRKQYPQLFKEEPKVAALLADLDRRLLVYGEKDKEAQKDACAVWVEDVRIAFGLPEMLPLYPANELHTFKDPIQEACEMVGPEKVIAVGVE